MVLRKHRKTERFLRWSLLAAGVLIFGALMRRVGLGALARMFHDADKGCWILAVFLYFLSMLFRGQKWYLLLSTVQKIRFGRFFPMYLVNNVMGTITPVKSGEAVGPVLFKRYLGIELGHGFSVFLIDRIFELGFILISLGFSFVYLALNVPMPALLYQSILIAFVMTVFVLALMFAVLFVERWGYGMTDMFIKWFRHGRLQRMFTAMREELNHFYTFRKNDGVTRTMFPLFLLTGLAWLFQFIAVWLVVISLLPVDFWASLAAQGIAIPISIVSMIPAGIGISAVGYQSIMALFGYAYEPVVGAALLSKILFLGLIFISGWLSSLCLNRPEVR
ncbi:flippase-like domain-containing protein [bacterium]|nr:flippase-like domain-containing protein [bacterium]